MDQLQARARTHTHVLASLVRLLEQTVDQEADGVARRRRHELIDDSVEHRRYAVLLEVGHSSVGGGHRSATSTNTRGSGPGGVNIW